MSGAKVKLSRDQQPNRQTQMFVLTGTRGQIRHARDLINAKLDGKDVSFYCICFDYFDLFFLKSILSYHKQFLFCF
jgi:hypothetical protein